MIDDGGKPLIAQTARGLGVRDGEIDVDDDDIVSPDSGGPSVALYSPENLPEHRRPRSLAGGTGSDPVWEIEDSELGERLACRIDPEMPDTHGFLEPVRPMPLAEYQEALAETRDLWRRWE
jgi:hypothetical protein